ncbi:hypothetical protein HMPREF0185_01094 [Brevundimonas diminuta 470-4]|jgi:hypothetical protein|uniref:DUF3606 domain-containing protein n=1 Tax=Brevundimonas sp. TaxID=1871086 RepID=UPI0002A43178|nr:DUF3606 domain-containing protein [Brevundimonas sp.]EKY29754.1 hypothetical protein HMPREF0185_01094 [Brevundimonas diminuta 470-4]
MTQSLAPFPRPRPVRLRASDAEAVRAWASRFAVTEDDLRRAIKKVGDRVDIVQRELME